MTITIKDKTVELKYGFRSLILYENITGKSFNPQTTTDVLVFMYSVILGSDKNVSLTFDEFLDMVDENPNMVVEFSEWLQKELDKNATIEPQNDSKKKMTETQ